MTPPTEPPLADRSERDEIRSNLDDTLFVEAAAGTGKTTALVGRIVEVLRRGRGTLDDIVAVTFTEKAAGEMKLRLRSDIEKARAAAAPDSEEAGRLELALEQLELAHIGTIHGFCTDLLKERPIEAGVDPAFQVAAEEEAGRLLDRAFEGWFQEVLSDPPRGVRRALRRQFGRGSGGPRAALRDAAWRLSEHRDFPAAWTRPAFDREAELERAVELVRDLGALADRAARPDDYLTRNLENLKRWAREIELRREVHGHDYDYLESRLRSLVRGRWVGWHWRGYGKDFGEGLLKADVLARRDAAREELEGILALADADLAAALREELRPVIEAYEALKHREGRLDFVDLLLRARNLLRDDRAIRLHYRRRFTHFFVDEFQDTDPLQVEILLLLSGDDPEETDLARLRPERGKLFLVGDPKQSIYRFRRADVMLYEKTRERLEEAGARVLRLTTSFRSQPRIQATVNGAFSTRMRGSEDGSQASYVPLSRFREDLPGQPAVVALPVPEPYGKWGTLYKRAIEDSLPDAVGAFVHWLVEASGWAVTERERPGEPVPLAPRHVCLLFRRLQSWGADVTRPYVRALEAREIPHVLVGGRSYFDREEVLAVRNALTAIEWPDDRLSVYAALRGPLFSLGDGTLFHFASVMGSLHPLAPYDELDAPASERPELAAVRDELLPVREALHVLGELHRRRNRRPVPETILRLLAEVRAHAGIAIWPTGEQALANVLRVVDRARAFERTGAPSFRAFLDRMEEEAERGQAEEAPIVEEGTEGVRMMTVHKAKGLEFPVVILADMTCNAVFDPPSRHVDPERGLWAEPLCRAVPQDLLDHLEVERGRELAEADRLAYVASTRARDLLVVPALGDGRDGEGGFPDDEPEWWLDALRPSLYPPAESRRDPAVPEGCPPFGPESVVERLDREGEPRPTPAGSVAPGLHEAESGAEVVWWDPAALDLGAEAPTGERQQRLIDVDEEEQRTFDVEEGIAAHDAWQAAHRARLGAGSEPELRVRTVKELAAEAAAAERPLPAGVSVEWIEVERPEEETAGGPPGGEDVPRSGEGGVPRPGDGDVPDPGGGVPGPGDGGVPRPGGERFGTLLHEALAAVPLDADGADVRRAVEARARSLGATDEEVAFANLLVERALAHPVLRRAAAAERDDPASVRREVPLHEASLDEAPLDAGPLDEASLDAASLDAARPEPLSPPPPVIHGVADLAFRETGPDGPTWIVVDYKTDRSISAGRAQYEAQVAEYARLLAAATGLPARGVVLAL